MDNFIKFGRLEHNNSCWISLYLSSDILGSLTRFVKKYNMLSIMFEHISGFKQNSLLSILLNKLYKTLECISLSAKFVIIS